VRDAQNNTLLDVNQYGLTSRSTSVDTTCNIADGQVRFYRDGSETASFNGNTAYDLGVDTYGCELNAGILVLNSNTLWVTESRNDPQLWQGMDETITINNTTYTFHHGLLVQAVQRQEPEEEPESFSSGGTGTDYYSGDVTQGENTETETQPQETNTEEEE
jgi:hypothetical protein